MRKLDSNFERGWRFCLLKAPICYFRLFPTFIWRIRRKCPAEFCCGKLFIYELKRISFDFFISYFMMDFQEVGCGCMDWIGLAQDRDRWRTLLSAVMNLRVP